MSFLAFFRSVRTRWQKFETKFEPPATGRVSLKIETWQLTTDELLKRMSKEQAIVFIQRLLRQIEESSSEPDAPAAKARMEKTLEELKRS